MSAIKITTLEPSPAIVARLGEILVAVVAAGGSVSFMHPLDSAKAQAFWIDSLTAAARGDRVVFGAWSEAELVATVTLQLGLPPNQPHRAEIAKLMTHPAYRRRGIAAALMHAAETAAVRNGKTLLVLDMAEVDGAAGFYEKLGFTFAGIIPDYALKPHGGLTGTKIYWKRLGDLAPGQTRLPSG